MTLKSLAAMGACALVGGCAYPVSTVVQGNIGAGLFFSNAPNEAHVWVDGADAGRAAAFNGLKSMLSVSPGRHQIVVRSETATFYDKVVYVDAETRIEVRVP